MREVRRLVILDWLLSGTGRALDQARRPPVRGGPGAGPGDPGEPADRRCGRRCAARCRSATAPPRRRPGTLAEDAAHDRVLVSLDRGFSPAAPVGADLAAAFGNLVDQAFTATYPGHPRFEPGDVEVTVRDLAAVYAHVERAVADPDGRVRLEGDIAAVRRVANALQVGMAGETHFLFGDDRFARGARSSSGPRPGTALQPQDPVTVGQIRGWIDAMRPELGLRDEVADLVVLAWAALRQRAWYQHGASDPGARGRARPGRTWNCGPSRCPSPADWQTATSRAEVLFGIRVNPYLTAAGVAEFTESLRDARGRAGRLRRGSRRRGWSWPTSTSACPLTARRPPGDRPRRGCAGGGLAPGRAAGSTWSRPWPGRRCQPPTPRSRTR